MNKIPLHKLSDTSRGEIAILQYIAEDEELPTVDYAHKDDYYIFLFLEKGRGKVVIDFKEYEMADSTVHCILPGQVHFPREYIQLCGWFIAIDSFLIKDEYKEIFEKTSLLENKLQLSEDQINDFRNCAAAIQKRLVPDRAFIQEMILHDLFSYLIGMFAENYQKGFPISFNDRFGDITYQFKNLLTKHYQTLKRPSQYASLLNLSPVYLNEAVKKTTGFSVSDYIQHEIILQANGYYIILI